MLKNSYFVQLIALINFFGQKVIELIQFEAVGDLTIILGIC